MSTGGEELTIQPIEYKCANCGAPLDVTPETIIAVCGYCGTPNVVAGEVPPEEIKNIAIVPSLDENNIIQKAVERTRKDPDMAGLANRVNFLKPIGVYVPFYFVRIKIGVDYRAKAKVHYRVSEIVHGQRVYKSKVKEVILEGSTKPIERTVPVLARRNVSGYSVKALIEHYMEKPAPAKPIWEFKWRRSEAIRVLSAEFLRDKALSIAMEIAVSEAHDKAVRIIEDEARAKAGVKDIVKVSFEELDLKMRVIDKTVSGITLLPYWMVPYTYNNGVYRYFMTGWDGEVVVAEEPVTAKHRLTYLLASIGGPGILGSAGLIAAVYGENQNIRTLGGVLFLAGLGIAWFSAKGITGSVRVESPYYTVDMEKEIDKLFEQARGEGIEGIMGIVRAYSLAKEYKGRR